MTPSTYLIWYSFTIISFTVGHDNSANSIFQVSSDISSGFPFAAVSINITKWIMECVRRGKFNKIMNEMNKSETTNKYKQQGVKTFMEIVNTVYVNAIKRFAEEYVINSIEVVNIALSFLILIFFLIEMISINTMLGGRQEIIRCSLVDTL